MTRSEQSNRLYGFIGIAVATTLFSSKAILIKMAYRHGVTPDALMTLRMLFSAPLYLAIAIHAKRSFHQPISLKTLAQIAFFGLCGYYIASFFDLHGLQYISASLERIVLYVYPTLVLIMSAIFLGKTIKPQVIFCIFIIYSGLILVFIQGDNSNHSANLMNTQPGQIPTLYFGGMLVFCSALAFAVFLIGSELLMRRLPSRLFTAFAMLAACIAITLHFSLRHPLDLLLQQSATAYGIILMIAFFCTVIPSFLLSSGIKAVGASTASAVGSLGPVATLIMAAILLDEHINGVQLLGFAVVIGGIALLGKVR